MDLKSVIIKPIMSEKSLIMANKGQYSFYIQPNATKNHVKQAMLDYFGTTPKSVTTITTKGGKKRVPGKRVYRSIPTLKKAIVTLKRGDSIPLFEQWYSIKDSQKQVENDTKTKKDKKSK